MARAKKDARHVRVYQFELDSAAYKSLSLGARCLLIELKALYNGSNNGDLFLSAREAAARLNSNRSSANRWFHELAERGFIRPALLAAFSWKVGAHERKATTWVLTEYVYKGAPPSREYQHWRPDLENKPRSPQSDKLSVERDSLSAQRDSDSANPPNLSRQGDRSPPNASPPVTPAGHR